MPRFLRNSVTGDQAARSNGRARRMRLVGLLIATCAATWPSIALANPPRPFWHPGPPWAPLACKSGEMCEISNLFWVMLVISAIVFFGVAGAIVLSIRRFSAREGQAEPTQVFGNRRIELAWTLIPTLILIVAFVATVKAINDINSSRGHSTFAINVVGHQWWWEFQYPKQNFVTANELHVPTGAFVKFDVQSYDVIHSFWSPELQRQIDANPGQDNIVYLNTNRPGIYSGACYEYCGEAHAWMKFREVVQTPAQFNAWIKSQQALAAKPKTALQKRGYKVFLRNTCVDCHAINGTTAGGAVGPNLTHLASRWSIGAGAAPMSEQALEQWIKDPNFYKPGVVMPGYPFLTKQDLHALAAYLISLK